MLLSKIEEVNPNYREELFEGVEIEGLDVYLSGAGEKIGKIDTLLVDEFGHPQYFVVDAGFWIFGKKVLLPVGLCQIELEQRRVRATGLRNKEQLDRLPRYEDGLAVHSASEEFARGVDRTLTVEASVPVEASLPLEVARRLETRIPSSYPVSEPPIAESDRDAYRDERDLHKFKLYEEGLVVEKSRQKAGEVGIRKQVKTETARISVPLEQERVIIENIPVGNVNEPAPLARPFEEQEQVRLEVYEEEADIQKQAFVREEIEIRKEVEQVRVQKVELLRREELNIEATKSSDSHKQNS